jgi:glycosyltransferase involved in cell wall biosynthesis
MQSNGPDREPGIAIFLPSLEAGGAERVMVNVACELVARGERVDLLVANRIGPLTMGLPESVRLVALGNSGVRGAVVPLCRYVVRERPRALLSALHHANIAATLGVRMARFFSPGLKTTLVLSVHSHLRDPNQYTVRRRSRVIPALIRSQYPHADAVVAVSGGVADEVRRLVGGRAEVRVIYNPLVTTTLLERSRESVNHPWFSSGEPPVLLSAGRLVEQKNLGLLIRAFARLRRRRVVRLMILGEGPERGRLEALVRELGLQNDVLLAGFVENPFAYMSQCATFALSSSSEGFGNVLVEALATGAPVVSTDCPSGPAEILGNGAYGRLVPPDDEAALADALEVSLDRGSDPVPAEWLAQFTGDAVVKQYLELLGSRGSKVAVGSSV